MKFSRTEALLNSFGNALISRYREKIKEYSSGKLYNTINFEITKGSSNYIVTINLEEYWRNISFGRKPGSRMPPVEAIENWIKITKWFVERAHERGQKDAEMGDYELKSRFESFEWALSAMVREFFKTVEALDEILEKANS